MGRYSAHNFSIPKFRVTNICKLHFKLHLNPSFGRNKHVDRGRRCMYIAYRLVTADVRAISQRRLGSRCLSPVLTARVAVATIRDIGTLGTLSHRSYFVPSRPIPGFASAPASASDRIRQQQQSLDPLPTSSLSIKKSPVYRRNGALGRRALRLVHDHG